MGLCHNNTTLPLSKHHGRLCKETLGPKCAWIPNLRQARNPAHESHRKGCREKRRLCASSMCKIVKQVVKKLNGGWWDCAAGNGNSHHARRPELSPRPHAVEEGSPRLQTVLWLSRHTWHVCTCLHEHAHAHEHTCTQNKCNNFFEKWIKIKTQPPVDGGTCL